MTYVVIGTAGHIDHGKSTLVHALTGTHPDRLEEEQRRGMTIDLGFAYRDLPGGRRAGFVDVPGHERLIRTMVAGAAGVDVVLLVVAADEGVMPQTREHLDILRFLGIRRGLIALTKVDLVDAEWLALVEADVARLVEGTFLDGAPVVRVSAVTGEGIAALLEALDAAAASVEARDASAPARLPVDRSFTMPGFGTVVTGTLWSGRVRRDDALVLLPAGRAVRVRGVQSHGERVEEARAGQRTALNLAGIGKDEIERGDVLVAPGSLEPTRLADARVRALVPLPHNLRVRVYLGADEVIARLSVLDGDHIAAGEEGYAQLRFERPAVAGRGDAFVLRRFSPLATLGGGRIVQPHAPRRRRGASHEVAALDGAGADALLSRVLAEAGPAGATAEELARALGVSREQVAASLGGLAPVEVHGRLFHREAVAGVERAIAEALAAFHQAQPWRLGMAREDLKRRAFGRGDDRLFAHVLDTMRGVTAAGEGLVALSSHDAALDPAQARVRDALERAYRAARFAPPAPADALGAGGDPGIAERMIRRLLDEGALVDVEGGMLFHRDALAEIRAVVVDEITRRGEVTVATLRDRLGSSRKYALALMGHFDRSGLTRRVGDRRVLASAQRTAKME